MFLLGEWEYLLGELEEYLSLPGLLLTRGWTMGGQREDEIFLLASSSVLLTFFSFRLNYQTALTFSPLKKRNRSRK